VGEAGEKGQEAFAPGIYTGTTSEDCQNRRKVMILWWWEAEVPA